MSIKNQPAVRFAIWNAYNRRCAISKNLIENITDMEIDHIISVATFKDKDKVRLYDLPENFELDGLENLRPVLRVWNREKSNQDLPSGQVNLDLMKAKKLKKLVEREIEKYHEEKKYALSIESIRESIQRKEISLEEYMDEIKGYKENFGDELIRIKNKFVNSIEVNSHSVRISAHLPRIREREGNCLFTFNSFYLRQVNITLTHEEILRTLYKGHKTPFHLSLRPYIIKNKLARKLKTYTVTLGGCVFNLELEEVNHLIKAIDIFMESYIEAMKKIENELESNHFYPLLSNFNNYKLLCIPTNLYEKILLFIRKHDYAHGDSNWHIFDAQGQGIKVYDKNKGKYRCFIYAVTSNNNRHVWYSSNDSVWLVWDYMTIEGEELWSAQKTYKWLVENLIPVVECAFKPKRNALFNSRKDNIKMNDFIYTSTDKYYDINKTFSSSSLLNIIESLQIMYSLKEYVYINNSLYLNIYDSIIYLVNISSKLDYHYISSKLGLSDIDNNEDLVVKINRLKQKKVNEVIHGKTLDKLYRVLYILVQDLLEVITEEVVVKILSLIREHVNTYNTVKLIESQYKI
ncbi:TPA: hypothetical protein QC222_004993 [Bacillus cereus]|nr:hypothetical protein [Bacillus cereus]